MQKTAALIIIRQNLTERPLNLILSEPDAQNVYITLKSAYEGSGPVLRQQLYLELHKIKVEDCKNTTIFISKFKDILSRITAVGARIEEIDINTIFIAALAKKYPLWAERQRAAIRNKEPVNLNNLINDILDERHGGLNNTTTSIKYSSDGDIIMKDAYYTTNNKRQYKKNYNNQLNTYNFNYKPNNYNSNNYNKNNNFNKQNCWRY